MKHEACNSPTYSFWALNAALSLTLTDERAIAAPPAPPPAPPSPIPSPPPPPTLSPDKVAAAWGIVVAVVGPSIAIAAWFILTWNYRCEKKIITDELITRLKVSDVCEVDSHLNGGSLGGHAEPSPETKKTARQITRRCLRRWDGFMGFRAPSNSGGIRAGIWRDKFDTVRCAVLLLAFRKLNQALQADHSFSRADCPGSLIAAWESSSSHGQRSDVVSRISKVVLNISEDEAQTLQDKDPEHPGLYDDICNKLTCCNGP